MQKRQTVKLRSKQTYPTKEFLCTAKSRLQFELLLASSKTRNMQQMLLEQLNPKQLPRLAEKRTLPLSAVPSHVIWIIKNQILKSLLCLNSHWLKNCQIFLLSTEKISKAFDCQAGEDPPARPQSLGCSNLVPWCCPCHQRC